MKMSDRQFVEGTEPAIYIGHRSFRRKDGSVVVSPIWHAEYSQGCRQRSKSLATTNKSLAIRNAHALAQKIADGAELKPVRRITLESLVKEYLETLTNRGRAPKTMEKYTFVLNTFADWWKLQGNKPADAVQEKHLWAFKKKLADAGKKPKTQVDRLMIIKQLFKWAAKKGHLQSNVLADATVPEVPPSPQPCFRPEQVELLLAKAGPNEKAIFAVMAYTGMRCGEVTELRWSDVLLDRGSFGFINVRLGGSNGTTKGKETRLLPINPKLRPVLDALPRNFDRVFTAKPSPKFPTGGSPVSERRLLTTLKRLCKKCGFANPKQYKLHTFRHAFASMCARTNLSYKYALSFMGHKSSEILNLYYTMYDETAEAAIKTVDYSPRPKQGSRSDAA